jgi:Tol biopolymer transport system component
VSPTGGIDPNWSADSRELYFTSVARGQPTNTDVFAVPVQAADPRFGTPRRILQSAVTTVASWSPRFAAAPDGKRFLLIAAPEAASTEYSGVPLSLILNWQALLRRD